MDSLTTFYFECNATLHDYLTMVNCLQCKDVQMGFATYHIASQSATLGVKMNDDADDFGCNLLDYPSIPTAMNYQQPDELDQEFDVSAGLHLAMSSDFDICQTKNMSAVWERIAKEYNITFEGVIRKRKIV